MRRVLFLCLTLFSALSAHSQYQLPGNVPSPNASELGKFGDIPVSYYTGQPNISIPLYSLTERGVTLDVSLQYDASGVLLNSLPGWTGHNWTLNAGGVITRVVHCERDEYIRPPHILGMLPFRNYFQSYSSLDNILQYDNSDHEHFKDSVMMGHNDFAADEFCFNFMGKTGKFFLGNDGEWKVYSEHNIDVIFDIHDDSNYIYPFIDHYPKAFPTATINMQPKTIKGFILRDDSGNRYYFGGSTDCIEYSIPFFATGDCEQYVSWTANSWYLKKVTDRFGNVLFNLSYVRGYFIAHFFNSALWQQAENHDSSWGGGEDGYTVSNYGFPYDAQLIAPIYLTLINTLSGGEIHFISSNTGLHMSSVYPSLYAHTPLSNYLGQHVSSTNYIYRPFYFLQSDDNDVIPYQYSGNYVVGKVYDPLESVQPIKLTSIYMTSTTSAGARDYVFEYGFPRMHLTRIKVMDYRYHYDPSNATIEEYRFKYNHYDLLPSDYMTRAIDHWGYYNGTSYSIPQSASDRLSFHLSRNPNTQTVLYGMLSEIVYPTGGKSVLEYEPNDFSQYLNETRSSMVDSTGIAGGVRIKSITDYEDTTSLHVLRARTFNYNDPVTHVSSGQLFAKPRYYWLNWKPVDENGGASTKVNLFRSSSILPLSNSFGPHFGYSYVRETDGDKTTEYHFTNISDSKDAPFYIGFSSNAPTPYDKYCERSYKRGKLLGVKTYQDMSLIQEVSYTYRTDNVENNCVLTSNVTFENSGNSGAFAHFNGDIYMLFYPKYDIVGKDVTNYEAIQSTLRTTYNKTDRLLEISNGSHTHYADVRVLESEAVHRDNTYYTSTHYGYLFDSDSSAEVNLSRTDFLLKPSITRKYWNNSLIDFRRTLYGSFNGLVVPAYELAQTNGATVADTAVAYLSYSPNGLLKKYREQGKGITNVIWDYTGSRVQALINDASYIPSPSFNANTSMSTIVDYFNNCRLTYGLNITSYTYNRQLQMTSYTTPLGYTTYYYYDKFGRLTDVKDTNGNTLQHFQYNYRQ